MCPKRIFFRQRFQTMFDRLVSNLGPFPDRICLVFWHEKALWFPHFLRKVSMNCSCWNCNKFSSCCMNMSMQVSITKWRSTATFIYLFIYFYFLFLFLFFCYPLPVSRYRLSPMTNWQATQSGWISCHETDCPGGHSVMGDSLYCRCNRVFPSTNRPGGNFFLGGGGWGRQPVSGPVRAWPIMLA